jgi:ectoine hydroxylase-related dioxygenase (phytanoyl-CoA dioxygenase family)
MLLTAEQVQGYTDQGFLFLPERFTTQEIDIIRAELPTVFAEDSARRVLEKNSKLVRSVYGSHSTNQIMDILSRHPGLVEPARQVLGSDVYIHQFKINAKAAFEGDVWQWHQDYIFWLKEDGMPSNRVVNAMVFLDDVNEFNGPLLIIPSSHTHGVIDVSARRTAGASYNDSPSWISNLTADLKYSLDRDTLVDLVNRNGIVAPKGRRGSVLFFNGNVVHGSAPNMSPFDRTILIVTYNSIENTLLPVENPRPEFLANRDYRPISTVLPDSLLLQNEVGAYDRTF